jgi:hypothetical protein
MDDPSSHTYSFKSDKSKDWEAIAKAHFEIKESKKGLFFEVFYSPYFDEVLQVAII